ncbi:MAG: ATP-dependent helicase [Thermomicrobiales bacterium]
MSAAEYSDNPFDDFFAFPPDDEFVAPRPKPDLPVPDEFQQLVIDATETSLRVIAPAGAGKTQTLVRRVMQRIEDGVPARRILVLTFDRNAKRSFEGMIQRMGMRVSPDIRTLNAFGWDILRRHFSDERYEIVKPWLVLGNRGINPANSKHRLVKQLAELGEAKDLVQIFDALKDHLFDPRDRSSKKRQDWIVRNYRRLVPDKFFQKYDERHAEQFALDISDEFREYEHFLKSHKVIDYQDQKLRTLMLLRKDAEVRALVQQRYDEVIVDEVQDINQLDAELIKTIAEKSTLVLTGDDDQAIYEFRWATPRFLTDPDGFFGRKFRTFELSLNYRCPPKILEHALPLIEHNRSRVIKHPKSSKPPGGEVTVAKADTTLKEARQILSWIDQAREATTDLNYHDFAVLYRLNAQHYLIQTELFRNRIPYTVNERFDLRIIWRKALTLLELSSKLRGGEPLPPEDRRAALSLYPSLGNLRPADLQWIVTQGKDTEKFPGTATHNAIADRMNAGTAGYFRSAIRELTTAKTLDDELWVIGSRFFGFSGQTEGEQGQIDESPIEELQNIARKMNVPRDQFIRRFGDFLRSAMLESGDATDRGVELSTCHGAKGREWKAVILPTCNDGKFPDFRSMMDDQDIEAERRLFYVSMTRTSQRLYISYVEGEEGKSKPPEPSRFLYEAKLLDEPPPKPKQQRIEQRTDARSERPGRTSRSGYEPPVKRTRSATGRSEEPTPIRRAPAGTSKGSAPAASSRKPTPITPDVTILAAAEALPPTIVTVPGKLKRKMTFPRDGDIRRFVAELTDSPDSLRLSDVQVEYEYLEATFPLQLALIVRGVPYQIAEEHRLLESSHLAAVYRTLTNAEPGYQRTKVAATSGNEFPYKGLTIRALVRVAREFDISSRKGTDVLSDALQHAVRANGDGDPNGVRFVKLAPKS